MTAASWPSLAGQPGVLAAVIAPTLVYAIGLRRLWRTAGPGRGIPRWRAASYAAGILVLAVALLSPLDTLADDLFSAHMTQHLLLMCVAAPLIVLGSPLVAALWALPHPRRTAVGRWWTARRRIRAMVAALGIPAVAWTLNALAIAVWHVPRAYDWALSSERVHAVEHASFIATACLFWWVALPGPGGRRIGHGAAVLYVTAMAAVMGIYSAVLTFATTPWYTTYLGRTAQWGFTPLADQQVAGVIMWIPTGLIYVGAALWCFVEWLRADERRSDRELAAPPVPAMRAATLGARGAS